MPLFPRSVLPAAPHAPTSPGTRRRISVSALAAASAGALLLTATPAEAATAIRTTVASTSSGQVAYIGSGTYGFSNFGSDNVGLNLAGKGGLSGAGTASTVVKMYSYTSTKGYLVPTSPGTSNPLYLMNATGAAKLSNFWLQGTAQGHLYNGLKISRGVGAAVTNVKITAVPGAGYNPPQETATINDQNGSGDKFSYISEDGTNIAALGLAANSASNVSISNSSFVNNRYSAGVALWQTYNATLTNVVSKSNRTGLNFERCSGTITIKHPTIQYESNQDLYIGSDQTSAKITITDPVYSSHLRIRVPATYRGVANRQRKSDIHVLVNGVDRTSSIVTWL